MLFKITFEIRKKTYYNWKKYKKHYIFFEITVQNPCYLSGKFVSRQLLSTYTNMVYVFAA